MSQFIDISNHVAITDSIGRLFAVWGVITLIHKIAVAYNQSIALDQKSILFMEILFAGLFAFSSLLLVTIAYSYFSSPHLFAFSDWIYFVSAIVALAWSIYYSVKH